MHLSVTPETTLRCAALAVTLAPAAGGRITSLSSVGTAGEPIDWLVPLADTVRATGFESTQWPKAGCYPLVPFSNRIRDGRLAGPQGRVQMPLHPGERHALHGVSQQRPWSLEQHAADRATMTYVHVAGDHGWPWAFRAEQLVELDAAGLSLSLRVSNEDSEPMPSGCGFHPYVPARFAHSLQFEACGVWPADSEFLASTPVPTGAADDYASAKALPEVECTRYYGAWNGQARMVAADGPAIELQATALQHLVLHRPGPAAYFCVEPVSHVADAANLAAARADTGWRVLAPGEAMECSLRLSVFSHSK
ncbi:aldose 1-epimerase [uncultured Ramlibacter sp.]|uniref:aldose 1-epimerase n=1 Tax=uncultured Ramlibacter sp. TaxID=260755 RepID=UPI0026379992|nr:aldose 1-epimerase [uncultured Ramlibacter sp.]